MKYFVGVFIALFFAQSSFSQSLSPRKEKAQIAAEQFLNLNFFYKGRGMIMPADFPPINLSSPLGQAAVAVLAQKLNDDYGLIANGNKLVGFSQVPYQGHSVGVVGCVTCHSGKAAGIFIPGLGNKNIDIFALAVKANQSLPLWAQVAVNDPVEKDLYNASKGFLAKISDPALQNHTQGLVSTGLIRKWFYDNYNEPMDSMAPSQVKVPALWGYGEKRKIGSFSDGGGFGGLSGWAVAVELVAGQTVEHVREYAAKIDTAEGFLADLLPKPYPFRVNNEMAQAGQAHFEKHCATCHGTYERDAEGLPIYETPELVPISIVKTDTGRLDGITPRFLQVVATNPLNDMIRASGNPAGYIAPRLVGVWAKFPYLHNASVPTVYDLLLPQEQRTKIFSLRRAGERERFDERKLGLTNVSTPTLLKFQRSQGARWVYDTALPEHSNQGHVFGFYSELNDQMRYEIIEYLKTL